MPLLESISQLIWVREASICLTDLINKSRQKEEPVCIYFHDILFFWCFWNCQTDSNFKSHMSNSRSVGQPGPPLHFIWSVRACKDNHIHLQLEYLSRNFNKIDGLIQYIIFVCGIENWNNWGVNKSGFNKGLQKSLQTKNVLTLFFLVFFCQMSLLHLSF